MSDSSSRQRAATCRRPRCSRRGHRPSRRHRGRGLRSIGIPCQCDLKLSRKFSPTMMMITNTRSARNISSVPTRSRAKVRRLIVLLSWEGRVTLPVADELDKGLDLHLAQDACSRRLLLVPRGIVVETVGDGSPVGHDAAVVLEVGEPVLDTAVVIVLVVEPKAVLFVERGPHAAFTCTAMTLGAVLVVEGRSLGERVHRVDDQVLVRVDVRSTP